MSGMEMIALSAALGAGVGGISAANKGQDPVTGALLGGATGAAGGALGGAFAPAAGTVGSTAGGAAATAYPVAMDAAIPALALDATGGTAANLVLPATAEWAAPHLVSGSIIPDLAQLDANMAAGTIAQTAGVKPPVSSPFADLFKGGGNTKQMFQMAGDVAKMGQQRQQQMDSVRPPPLKQASAPQVAAPIASLLQERERMPRRRISLL